MTSWMTRLGCATLVGTLWLAMALPQASALERRPRQPSPLGQRSGFRQQLEHRATELASRAWRGIQEHRPRLGASRGGLYQAFAAVTAATSFLFMHSAQQAGNADGALFWGAVGGLSVLGAIVDALEGPRRPRRPR
ncbi:MAG: hypothetical protein IT371_27720 [Deltaproteobacteria bacterium]|nr:hypothetical protein [Deltaproteobacteria bacterium]